MDHPDEITEYDVMRLVHKELIRLFGLLEIATLGMKLSCSRLPAEKKRLNDAFDELFYAATYDNRPANNRDRRDYSQMVAAAKEFNEAWEAFKPVYDKHHAKDDLASLEVAKEAGHTTHREVLNAFGAFADVLVKASEATPEHMQAFYEEADALKKRVRADLRATSSEDRRRAQRLHSGLGAGGASL